MWADVDWEKKTFRYWEEKKDKWRTKELISPMVELLKNIPRGKSEYILTGPGREPLKDCKRAFKTVLKKAGIKDFRFHDLRRSSATFLLKAGCPLPVIQKHLEHTSLAMTQKYLHLNQEAQVQELEKLGNILPGEFFTGQKMGRSENFEEMPIAGTA